MMRKMLLPFILSVVLLTASFGCVPIETLSPSIDEHPADDSSDRTVDLTDSETESSVAPENNHDANVMLRPITLSEQLSDRTLQHSTLIKKVTVLPENLETGLDYTKDTLSGSTYHIASLDLNLEIPEGCGLYGRKALYKDADNDLLTLSFVDEYMLVIQEDAMAEVDEDIRTIISEGNPNQNPPYVIFSFRVFRKEYLPVENLYRYALNDSCEYRTIGAYYIAFGMENDEYALGSWLFSEKKMSSAEIEETIASASAAVTSVTKQLKDFSSGTDVYFESDYPAYLAEQKVLLFYGTRPVFRLGTCSVKADVSDDGSRTEIVSDPDISILNDEWWSAYCSAEKALRDTPTAFAYQDIGYSYESELPQDDELRSYDASFGTGWVLDSENDQTIRAYCYANAKKRNEDAELKDLIVMTRDSSSGQRLFYAFLHDESGEFIPFECGIDQITGMDLEFAREYMKLNLLP